MKMTYSFILLFVGQFLFSQIDSTLFPKNQIKLSPIRVLGPDRGIEFNYERQIRSNFTTQLTARYITDIFKDTPQRSYNKLTGVAIYLEPKYYYQINNQSRTFLSLSFGYVHCTFENIDDFLNVHADTINELEYFFKDTVNINRQLFDLNFNYGIQKYYKNIVFEFSVGLGLRYRDVKLENKLYEDSEMYRHRHEFFLATHRDGSFFVPNIPFRLKIGYMF
jgi:hypothetical protein